uniref:E3 ubiquitin-protein ligase TRIM39-like n=1 Tax=Geotrypetes seraphini TaxID=260995 RepID=A0A6P8NLX0_GEOSA|nr:E3 ubiquitin-protein ligase TRIM39-like [Geotrypetes seraphini]
MCAYVIVYRDGRWLNSAAGSPAAGPEPELADSRGITLKREGSCKGTPQGLPAPGHLKEVTLLKGLWHPGIIQAANVTLDPETAHPELILSEDWKSVRRGKKRQDLPDNPKRFDTRMCVLGRESFSSGRHYWEVEVGEKTGWGLGVCKDSVSRKRGLTPSSINGYWVLLLKTGGKYWACTSPWSQLHLRKRPQAVGIFLDYEAGTVSFYNADNKSHLFSFTDTFTEKLWPYFNPCLRYGDKCAGALKIQPVSDWE